MTLAAAVLMLCLQSAVAHEGESGSATAYSALFVFVILMAALGIWVSATTPWVDDRSRIMVKIQQRVGPDGQLYIMPVECV